MLVYKNLRGERLETKEFHNIYTRYKNRAKLRENSSLSMSLRTARPNQEKAAIYSRHLHTGITKKDLDEVEK